MPSLVPSPRPACRRGPGAFRLICPYSGLPAERGVAALVDGERVAVSRTADDGLHALGDLHPSSGAGVLARGTVGSRGDRHTVTSPADGLVFDLETGQCLDDPAVRVPVHAVRVRDGIVEVALHAAALSA